MNPLIEQTPSREQQKENVEHYLRENRPSKAGLEIAKHRLGENPSAAVGAG